jgi:hypothetical protein
MNPDTISFGRHRAWRGRSVIGIGCALALSVAACGQREIPLSRSTAVSALRAHDIKTVESSIESALVRRHWAVKEHVGQRYVAELHENVHRLVVAIVYDAQNAHIDYVSSENLQYRQKFPGEVIHRSYARWVNDLADDIRANVVQFNAMASADPPR